VALARMLLNPANTLLLDEPTNHLDPASVDVLTDALLDFPGTIIFISHDPIFLSRMATRVVEIEGGRALDYPGDYAYYLWKQEQEFEAAADEEEDTKRNGQPSVPVRISKSGSQEPDRRDLVKALDRAQRQLVTVEAGITKLEERIHERDEELKREELYQEHERWHALHLERQQWDADLERLLEEWTRHSGTVDEIRQQISAIFPKGSP
jgi:ATP-binding cassette, subfamily F, member 3